MQKPVDHHIHRNTPHTDEAAAKLTPHHRLEPHRQPLSNEPAQPTIPDAQPRPNPVELGEDE